MLKNLSFGLSFVVKNVREHGATKQIVLSKSLNWQVLAAVLSVAYHFNRGSER